MRAREFVENKEQVKEFAPIVAALGGALARGAATAGSALARRAVTGAEKIGQTVAGALGSAAKGAVQGVATQLGKNIGGSVAGSTGTTGTSGSTATPTDNKPTSPQPPANIPTGTKIEPVVSQDPNKMGFKIGDAVFSLDTKDPKNAQVLTQLNQLAPKQS